jgi:hypothetical protein
MMRLRDEQVAALDHAVKERFYRRLAILLREQFPAQTAVMTEEALMLRIRASGKTAASYGIKSERGIARAATLSVAFGERFHEISQIRQGLKRGGKDAEQFLEWLLDECAREAHKQASKLSG